MLVCYSRESGYTDADAMHLFEFLFMIITGATHLPYTRPRDTTMLHRFSLTGVPQYIPFGVDGVDVVVYAPALVVGPLTSVALAAPAGDAEHPLQYAGRRLPRRRLQYVRGGSKSRSPRVHLRNATEVDTSFVANAG